MVLDTNVISELIRPDPAPDVLAWFARQQTADLATTVITEAELRAGARRLPAGRRQLELAERIERSFAALRVLDVDRATTPFYAQVLASRRTAGRPIGPLEAFIAAICARHGLPVVTRHTRDFEGYGVTVINPWMS